MPSFIGSIVISSEDKKRFERFSHLSPPKLYGFVGEDAHESLIDYCKKLHNLGLLDLHSVSYTTL